VDADRAPLGQAEIESSTSASDHHQVGELVDDAQ
jgi:hypothetical protein